MDATKAYRASRDQLLSLHGQHERAVAEFRWPDLGDRFNWAVDWFDAVAAGNDRPALVIAEEDGSVTERSFAGMSRDSDRLASWLADRGVAKGDPVEHPAVAEAAVVPAPDPVRLAVPKAYISLAPGHEPTRETAFSILNHAREQLNPYQRLRRIEFTAELPKTISGKIRRVELRAREEHATDGDTKLAEWRDDQFPELKS